MRVISGGVNLLILSIYLLYYLKIIKIDIGLRIGYVKMHGKFFSAFNTSAELYYAVRIPSSIYPPPSLSMVIKEDIMLLILLFLIIFI